MTEHYDVLSSDEIKSVEIMNLEGENLGKIDEIFVDLAYGRIAYATVSWGGFLGMGGQFRPIPWQAFTWSPQGKRLILGLDKQALKDAPAFDEESALDLGDREGVAKIFEYYGRRPYWESERPDEQAA